MFKAGPIPCRTGIWIRQAARSIRIQTEVFVCQAGISHLIRFRTHPTRCRIGANISRRMPSLLRSTRTSETPLFSRNFPLRCIRAERMSFRQLRLVRLAPMTGNRSKRERISLFRGFCRTEIISFPTVTTRTACTRTAFRKVWEHGMFGRRRFARQSKAVRSQRRIIRTDKQRRSSLKRARHPMRHLLA